MRIDHYTPEHPLLKPLIAGIYSLKRDADEPAEHYLAFPGLHHFVTIHRSAEYHRQPNYMKVVGRSHCLPSALLIANFDCPRIWSYEGAIEEWNICFNPLAINYFLPRQPLHSGVTRFHSSASLNLHLQDLYRSPDPYIQVKSIESYWLSRLRPFRHAFLPELMQEMLDDQPQRQHFGIHANRYGVSRTTFHHEFKRYVGITPARFEKISRFRQALSVYRQEEKAGNLTAVSAKADYFDQSHMIRDFRALTGYTPKVFYKKIACFPKGEINWIFT